MTAPVVTTQGRTASLLALTTNPTPGPITMILMAAGHNFQVETDFVSDISGDEITATGYTRKTVSFGAVDTSVTGVVSLPTLLTDFGFIGGAVDATISGCYLFADTGDDATSPIYACVPFIEEKITDGTNYSVTGFSWIWSPTPF